MKIAALALVIPLWLCGCTASLQTRLDHAKPPEALVLSREMLNKEQRRATFEAHRGYVNDLGVQIGKRHFDAKNLADYFRRSRLEPFARDAESVQWGREAKAKNAEIKKGYHGMGTAELFRGGVGGGSGGGEVLIAFMAVAIVVELVGVITYQAWKIKAETEIRELSRKSAAFKGSSYDLMENYNRWLAYSLGVSLTADVISPSKPIGSSMPPPAKFGVNAEKNDWLDEYRLELVAEHWYFGGREVDPETVMEAYGGPAIKAPKHGSKGRWLKKNADALNLRFSTALFPNEASHSMAETE